MTNTLTTRDIAARLGCSPAYARRVAQQIAQAHGISRQGRDWLIPGELVDDWKPQPVGKPRKKTAMNGEQQYVEERRHLLNRLAMLGVQRPSDMYPLVRTTVDVWRGADQERQLAQMQDHVYVMEMERNRQADLERNGYSGTEPW